MLSSAKGTYDICRRYFKYNIDYWYFYILGCSDKFLFGAEENDFQLNGFQIRKISDLKKVEKKDALYAEINRNAHILENINDPIFRFHHGMMFSFPCRKRLNILSWKMDMRKRTVRIFTLGR